MLVADKDTEGIHQIGNGVTHMKNMLLKTNSERKGLVSKA